MYGKMYGFSEVENVLVFISYVYVCYVCIRTCVYHIRMKIHICVDNDW